MLPIADNSNTAAAPELTEAEIQAQLLQDAAAEQAASEKPAEVQPEKADEQKPEAQGDEGQGTEQAEEQGDKSVASPILDELRAMRAELAELKAAKAADASGSTLPAPGSPLPNPTEAASTRTLAQIDAEEAQARRELRYLADKIAKGESHIEPDGTEYTPAQMQAMLLDRQDRLYVELPRARAAAQATTTQRTTVEAAVRQQYPTQFVPGTPAAAMRATVEKEFAHIAHLPDAPRIIAEVTVGRLAARAIKPAPKAPAPNLPTGSATRPSVTGAKQPLDTNAQLAALRQKYPNGDIPEEELLRLM